MTYETASKNREWHAYYLFNRKIRHVPGPFPTREHAIDAAMQAAPRSVEGVWSGYGKGQAHFDLLFKKRTRWAQESWEG